MKIETLKIIIAFMIGVFIVIGLKLNAGAEEKVKVNKDWGWEESLSDNTMERWEGVILMAILKDIDFLSAVNDGNLEKLERDFNRIKYVEDTKKMETLLDILEDLSPYNTHFNGGDCEDQTAYVLSRFVAMKRLMVGFVSIVAKNNKANEKPKGHMVAIVTDDSVDGHSIIDLTAGPNKWYFENMNSYMRYANLNGKHEFYAYRIWWLFIPSDTQPKIKKWVR